MHLSWYAFPKMPFVSLLIIHSEMTSWTNCGLHVTQMAWMNKIFLINQRISKRVKAYCTFATSMFSVFCRFSRSVSITVSVHNFSSLFVFTIALKNYTQTLSHTCYDKNKKQYFYVLVCFYNHTWCCLIACYTEHLFGKMVI